MKLVLVLLVTSISLASICFAEDDGAITQSTFERFSSRVVKIQVFEKGSAAKSTIGSGFFVSPFGHLVTNYHVVSEVVQNPEKFRVECQTDKGVVFPLEVVVIDVIHDLAVAKAPVELEDYFKLEPVTVMQGRRLYSLGHPHDIGLSIIEGTFNGFLKHSRYQKIHFTGSINPGMSGGPTISAEGHVVGINVSTAGNQLSFLVPVIQAMELYEPLKSKDYRPVKDFRNTTEKQLNANQEHYFGSLLSGKKPKMKMGRYSLPSKIAPYFRCWGIPDEKDPKQLYSVKQHRCSTDDSIFISKRVQTGTIEYRHRWIHTDKLNRFRFYTLYGEFFKQGLGNLDGDEDSFTNFKCKVSSIRQSETTMRTSFCMRGYRKYRGLYDVIFKVATLEQPNAGVETTLLLCGIGYENAQKVVLRYLKSISWTK